MMVWVAEAGYCLCLIMYEDKLQLQLKEKELQHKRLQEALSAYGYEKLAVTWYLASMAQSSTTTAQSTHTRVDLRESAKLKSPA